MKSGRTGNNGRYIEYRDIERDCLYWKDTHNNKYIITTGTAQNIESLAQELSVDALWAHKDVDFPASISITEDTSRATRRTGNNYRYVQDLHMDITTCTWTIEENILFPQSVHFSGVINNRVIPEVQDGLQQPQNISITSVQDDLQPALRNVGNRLRSIMN